jgi:ubiquitin-protein ligase
MNALAERVKQDLRKIEALSKTLDGRIKVKSTDGSPINKIVLEINYPTAASRAYPDKIQNATEVRIELLSRYPFQEPTATITTPIYHPNVYTSGKICFGTKWLPTQGLDLLAKRIIQIITFDESILNEKSPANSDALHWYREARGKTPNAFPTDKLEIRETKKSTMSWKNIEGEKNEKTLVSCPQCNSSLRVATGKSGNISCPKCNEKFFIRT